MLDIYKWEEVGQDLRELHSNGVCFPSSIWETFELVRSVLEPLQTDSEEEGEKDDKDQFKKTKEGQDDDKGSETASTIIPKNLYPGLEECFTDDCPPPPSHWPLPPLSCLEQTWKSSKSIIRNNNPFLSKNIPQTTKKSMCSSLSTIECG